MSHARISFTDHIPSKETCADFPYYKGTFRRDNVSGFI